VAQGYRPQLDGLRALAIALVGFEHFSGPLRWYFPLGAGALGVHLFFVLSGFLITRNLLARLDRRPTGEVMRHFFIGRVARLAPAYFLTLLVLFVLGAPEVTEHIIWHVTWTSNYLAASGGPLLVFWSLSVEEQFYLLLPLLLLLVTRNAVGLAVGLILTGFILRNAVLATPIDPFAFEISIIGKLEILGVGVLIGALSYAAFKSGRTFLFGPLLTRLAIASLLVQAVIWCVSSNGVARHLTFNLTVGLFFAWIVLRADAGLPGPLAWLSEYRFVRFVGKISYGIYLTHAFFPQIFESKLVLAQAGSVPIWAQGIVVILLSVAVPALSWFLMEAPILRLKDCLLNEPVPEGEDRRRRARRIWPPLAVGAAYLVASAVIPMSTVARGWRRALAGNRLSSRSAARNRPEGGVPNQ
jgi:peptidoglycan/LPS O-acetylase OafA/YrhL